MQTFIWILGVTKPLISKLHIFILISSCPSNVDKIKGNTLILIIWLSTHVLLGYSRSIIAYYVQNYSSNGMFWYGVNVQLGALIGSIIIYHLIETFSLLNGKMPC
ncbi:unnamed protein product, partial [Rotaria sp. Silwood2]